MQQGLLLIFYKYSSSQLTVIRVSELECSLHFGHLKQRCLEGSERGDSFALQILL